MARKVFMSVIGNGMYYKCKYIKDEFVSTETRFVQQATLQMLNSSEEKWTENDCAYFLLTEEARRTNWQVEGNKRKKSDGNFEDYIGLHDYLEQDKFPFQIKDVDIEIGRNEEEIWKIFSTIYDCLKEGDELYFDLSYSFRYLPMLLIVLGNYAKFLKKAKVKSITYGYYDSKDNKPGLIIDVTSFSTLQDWTFAGASFVEMGKVQNFAEHVSSAITKSDLKKSTLEDIKVLTKRLVTFEHQIETCRGNEIVQGRVATEIKDILNNILNINCLPSPLNDILEQIKYKVTPFMPDSIENLKHVLDWCKCYGLVQQGYTICQEGIVTMLCKRFASLNPYNEEEKKAYRHYRDYWSSILGVDKNSMADEKKWKNALACNRSLTHAIFNLDWVHEFRKCYSKLQNNRNQVNHAGFIGNTSSADIINAFEKCIDECLLLFERTLDEPVIEEKQSSVLVNLSNHPSEKWGDEQRQAAEAIGTIVDMPFPMVEPEATATDIGSEANRLVAEIMKYAVDNMVTVHVMGEMSLTYAVVSKLSAYGVRCVCSTTNRVVREEGDGKRMVEFHFKQFRDYV